jgi:hypothetical protein
MLEANEHQFFIPPDGFHQGRSCPVCRRSDLPRERRRLERCAAVGQRSNNQQPLAGLDIHRNPHRQFRVNAQSFIVHRPSSIVHRPSSIVHRPSSIGDRRSARPSTIGH